MIFVVSIVSGAMAQSASASRLSIDSLAAPSVFSVGANKECADAPCDRYQITVRNASNKPAEAPIIITDTLPEGLVVDHVEFRYSGLIGQELGFLCETGPPVSCRFPISLGPDQSLEMTIHLTVEAGAPSGATNLATVSEAENPSPDATTSQTDTIGTNLPQFGVDSLTSSIADFDGSDNSQAGDHPYEFTTRINLRNTIRVSPTQEVTTTSIEDVRDVAVDLPLGFLGSALAAPKCTLVQLDSLAECPPSTRVGQIITEPESAISVNSGIFNMVPEHGVPVELGFTDALDNAHVIYTSVVPTPSGYVLRATSPEVPQVPLTDIVATLYGSPSEKSGSGTPVAMFTNPSDCSGAPLKTTVHLDSWEQPGSFNGDGTPNLADPRWKSATSESPAVTGCNKLRFEPSAFSARPDTTTADSPAGLKFDLQIPQTETPQVLATPPLKDATVTFPPGLIINPSAAAGLGACSIAQIGWLGGSSSNFTPGAPSCPDASKIGTVEVLTPLLPNPLTGSIYLAAQNENPFHSLLAGYIVVDDPATGVIVKIAGKLEVNPQDGRITGIFDENPQLPFSELKLSFFGGPRGELATPEGCGTFTTTAQLTPWSAPDSGPPATPSDSFSIAGGCGPGFSPAFAASTTLPRAGSFSPLTMSFSREDSEQELSGLSITLPPGLLAKLASVAKCPEPALAAAASDPSGAAELASPACPPDSRLGSVKASAGVGPAPYTLSGSAYLTGPYKGAPYGIAVLVPAVAGPFDLGNVLVRATIQVDKHDGHVTVASDPFPTIVDKAGADGHTDGFPIRLRRVDVTIDRPGFTLNPTNCTAMAISGILSSTSGQLAAVSSHFQVDGCRELAFKPKFAVATQAKASKAQGASLHVQVSTRAGEANIARVRVALPKQLPSRLTTLQKACTDTVFNANPASCPAASLVGSAKAVTPLLSGPLTGPAYLVSHASAAFPDLVIVLQGEGIVLYLDGATDIKKGVTTSTFNTVPDAPVSSFELSLPEGPHSILAANLPASANYNLCGQKLTMPTVITGQNGAIENQPTKITIAGCVPHKAKKHKAKKHKRGRRKRH